MDRNELIDKLLKVQELATRGEGGERENAVRFLNSLMEKYGISEDELLQVDECELVWFRYKHGDILSKKLLSQIIYSVMGQIDTYSRGRKSMVGVECTKVDAVEIEARFAFYQEALYSDIRIFWSAFVHRNNIFPPDEKVQSSDASKSSTAEKDEVDFNKVKAMMGGLDKHGYYKQLS